jgi:uncharacterized ferritin-like protein (DUF455 family)
VELSVFASDVLLSDHLEKKLKTPKGEFTDQFPGESVRYKEPVRPDNLQFAARRTAPAMPKLSAFTDPAKRAIAHHIMANHELQALEVMAATLLAYPTAPAEFRFGLARVMLDEQRHTRMHAERAKKLGVEFGTLPVNCFIWKKSQSFTSVLDYLAGLPLVFEGANLDHSMEFAEAFEAAGDLRSAQLMKIIHEDEIEHVKFGIEWLRHFKPAGQSDYDCFTAHLHFPLKPTQAKGELFQLEARRKAGLDEDFITRVQELESRKSHGQTNALNSRENHL